ncbi:MAG TPA: hypothetical protein PK033_14965, partial [Acetivibrio sp.]|nr:hypothetical protein [Acetivibrio sp.]
KIYISIIHFLKIVSQLLNIILKLWKVVLCLSEFLYLEIIYYFMKYSFIIGKYFNFSTNSSFILL